MIAGLIALLVAALVLGALIIGDTRRRGAGPIPWQAPAWISLGCGIAGVLALAAPMIGSWTAPDGVDRIGRLIPWLPQASITLGLTGLVLGGYALARHGRTWQALAGLVASGLLTAFWLVFLIGEASTPH